jgi:predicted ester cyclase
MAHDYRAMAERIYSIFERGAVDELQGVFAPGFIEHEELSGSDAVGIDLVVEWVNMSTTAFPDARYMLESVVGQGDEAVCRVRLTGTHRGPVFGIPATGNKVDVLIMDWVRLTDDGQVAEHWGAMEESKLMQQLGVAAPPAQIDLTTPTTTQV